MQIFISYRRQDQDFATKLRYRLESWGYDVWIDVANIRKGASWADAIDAGLQSSQIISGLLTPESIESRNVKNEWYWAIKNEKPLILLLLRDIPPDKIPHQIVVNNYIDFRNNNEKGFEELKTALELHSKLEQPLIIQDSRKSVRDKQNRQKILKRVQEAWIEGVLVFPDENRISLNKELSPDAVKRAWEVDVVHRDYGSIKLPADINMIDIFEKMEGTFLILGESGSGKTTALLELTRDLIQKAELDLEQPIPIVFNLSSWAIKRKPLQQWIVEELNSKYLVPRSIGMQWLENDEILLLLDGLDEVYPDHRYECVRVINTFRKNHGFVDIVVCSRTQEYQSLNTLLELQGCVLLHQLSSQQLYEYFDNYSVRGTMLRRMVENDKSLQDLIRTPLMLKMFMEVQDKYNIDSFYSSNTNTLDLAHRQLMDLYVSEMFNRKKHRMVYPKENIKRWLTWLAFKMQQNKQTIFLIEELQPAWLPQISQSTYKKYVKRGFGLLIGFLVGIAVSVSTSLALEPIKGNGIGIIAGLISGVIIGLITGLAWGSQVLYEIYVIDKQVWSASYLLKGTVFGSGVGISVGLIFSLLLMNIVDIKGIIGILLSSIISGGLIGGFVNGLRERSVEEKIYPNQGIWSSVQSAVQVISIFLFSVGFGSAMSVIFTDNFIPKGIYNFWLGLLAALIGGLASGLIVGSYVGIPYAGEIVIQHTILRFLLFRHKLVPLNYARMLNEAVELSFLRRVGGGYIFAHRVLRDYFATLWNE